MSITKISPSVVDFDAGITISTADNTTQLTLKSTDADANSGPVLELYRNSSSPADGDDLGRVYFYGENDNDEKIEMVLMRSSVNDVSDGSEDSQFQIYTYVGGSQKDRLKIDPTETVFNDGSADLDFRVESDNSANALFVQGSDGRVGFNTNSPAYGLLDIRQTGTGVQDRAMYIDCTPASSGSNANAVLISAGNGNMTNTVMRIHHESPAANQKLLSLDTTGSNTEKFWVDEDGDALLTGGLFLGGSADANKLDDYEEGTATISIESTGTNPTISEGNTFTAQYTKIGNMVTVRGYTGTRNITNAGSGLAKINQLPFTNHASYYGVVSITHGTMFGDTQAGYVEANQTFFYPIQEGSTSGVNFSTGTHYFMFSVTYMVA